MLRKPGIRWPAAIVHTLLGLSVWLTAVAQSAPPAAAEQELQRQNERLRILRQAQEPQPDVRQPRAAAPGEGDLTFNRFNHRRE